jgi:hypothetical protein
VAGLDDGHIGEQVSPWASWSRGLGLREAAYKAGRGYSSTPDVRQSPVCVACMHMFMAAVLPEACM